MLYHIILLPIRTLQTILCRVSVRLCLFYPSARVFFTSLFLSSLSYQSSLVVDVTPTPLLYFLPSLFSLSFLFHVHCRRPLALPVPTGTYPHLFYSPFFSAVHEMGCMY